MTRALSQLVDKLDVYGATAKRYSKQASVSIYDTALQYQPSIKLYVKMASWYIAFVLWVVLWIPIGFVLTLLTVANQDKRQYYNCSAWALRQWVEHGGYMAFRWCRNSREGWIKWPHFLWIGPEHHGNFTHYVPYKKNDAKHFFPPLYFTGYVKSGDDPKSEEGS